MTCEMIDLKKAVRRSLDVKKLTMVLCVFAAMLLLFTVTTWIATGGPVGLIAYILSPFGVVMLVFGIILINLMRNVDDYRVCCGYLNDRRTTWQNRGRRDVRYTAEFTTPDGEEIRKKTRWLWTEHVWTDSRDDYEYENEPVLFAYDPQRKRLLVLGTERAVLKAAEEDAAKETI